MKNYKFLILNLTIFMLSANYLFAENEFGLRLAPALVSPLRAEQLKTGAGVTGSFDWTFYNFAKYFDLGVSAGGVFASLLVQVGESLILFEGKAGPFVRWRPNSLFGLNFERWAFQAGVNIGIYRHTRGEDSDTRGLFSTALGAQYHISPYFSGFAETGFTRRVFGSSPLTSFDLSLGIRINLSELMGGRARVQVEKTQQHRVFPVSYAWYEHNPVAEVRLTNEEPNAITDLHLTFFMDSYMSQPWTFAVVPRLEAAESVNLPVTALFNEALMTLTETVNANGTIQIQYRSLGARKETSVPVQMPVFHRNTLSWDDDRRAAAFVSPRDSAARYFARYVAAGVEEAVNNRQLQAGNTPSNVVYAAALFEALRLYGISYVVVPATSFARVAADESVLDNVSFPYQALHYRGGDCSYLSILFCSMLEALDIESAFITIPGHIYIAFEVGDDTWQANNSSIIQLDGKRWLPLELTVPSEGFSRGWRIGAQQWQNNRGQAELYPIREAWKVYPSVTVPASGDQLPEMPNRDEIIRAVGRELR